MDGRKRSRIWPRNEVNSFVHDRQVDVGAQPFQNLGGLTATQGNPPQAGVPQVLRVVEEFTVLRFKRRVGTVPCQLDRFASVCRHLPYLLLPCARRVKIDPSSVM